MFETAEEISREEEERRTTKGALTSAVGFAAMFGSELIPQSSIQLERLNTAVAIGGAFVVLKGAASVLRSLRRTEILNQAEDEPEQP